MPLSTYPNRISCIKLNNNNNTCNNNRLPINTVVESIGIIPRRKYHNMKLSALLAEFPIMLAITDALGNIRDLTTTMT